MWATEFLKAIESPEQRLAWLVTVAADAIQIVALWLPGAACRQRTRFSIWRWPRFLPDASVGTGHSYLRWLRNSFLVLIYFRLGPPLCST